MMRETEFIVTEQFRNETGPDREIVRQAVTAWLSKALFPDAGETDSRT